MDRRKHPERSAPGAALGGAAEEAADRDRIFGDSASYVLRHAPCEVIVNLAPSGYPLGGSADEVLSSTVANDPSDDSASDAPERK